MDQLSSPGNVALGTNLARDSIAIMQAVGLLPAMAAALPAVHQRPIVDADLWLSAIIVPARAAGNALYAEICERTAKDRVRSADTGGGILARAVARLPTGGEDETRRARQQRAVRIFRSSRSRAANAARGAAAGNVGGDGTAPSTPTVAPEAARGDVSTPRARDAAASAVDGGMAGEEEDGAGGGALQLDDAGEGLLLCGGEDSIQEEEEEEEEPGVEPGAGRTAGEAAPEPRHAAASLRGEPTDRLSTRPPPRRSRRLAVKPARAAASGGEEEDSDASAWEEETIARKRGKRKRPRPTRKPRRRGAAPRAGKATPAGGEGHFFAVDVAPGGYYLAADPGGREMLCCFVLGDRGGQTEAEEGLEPSAGGGGGAESETLAHGGPAQLGGGDGAQRRGEGAGGEAQRGAMVEEGEEEEAAGPWSAAALRISRRGGPWSRTVRTWERGKKASERLEGFIQAGLVEDRVLLRVMASRESRFAGGGAGGTGKHARARTKKLRRRLHLAQLRRWAAMKRRTTAYHKVITNLVARCSFSTIGDMSCASILRRRPADGQRRGGGRGRGRRRLAGVSAFVLTHLRFSALRSRAQRRAAELQNVYVTGREAFSSGSCARCFVYTRPGGKVRSTGRGWAGWSPPPVAHPPPLANRSCSSAQRVERLAFPAI